MNYHTISNSCIIAVPLSYLLRSWLIAFIHYRHCHIIYGNRLSPLYNLAYSIWKLLQFSNNCSRCAIISRFMNRIPVQICKIIIDMLNFYSRIFTFCLCLQKIQKSTYMIRMRMGQKPGIHMTASPTDFLHQVLSIFPTTAIYYNQISIFCFY